MKHALERTISGGFVPALVLLAGVCLVSFRIMKRLNEGAARVKNKRKKS